MKKTQKIWGLVIPHGMVNNGKYVEFLMFHDVPRGLHTTVL